MVKRVAKNDDDYDGNAKLQGLKG